MTVAEWTNPDYNPKTLLISTDFMWQSLATVNNDLLAAAYLMVIVY